MAGRAYCPTSLQEISWGDLQWIEIQHGGGGAQEQEEVPVREEIVEDNAGVISSVVVPTPTSVPEDAMEEGSEESSSLADN